MRERVLRAIARLPVGHSPRPFLLLGETGTGKGVLARAIHRAGPRGRAPFVDLNCAAIPDTLLEAELFGFERGAFTDARQAKPGLVEAAHRGTLFLDEVGMLPLALQAKLLGILEDGTVRRLGSTRSESVDVWLIAATSADLEAATAAGRFREDLYHRLAVLTFRLPPLRERADDVVLLAEHFLARACADAGVPAKSLTPAARAALRVYAWPGNVRELRNVMERVAVLLDGAEVGAEALGVPPAEPPPAGPWRARAAPGAGGEGDRGAAESLLGVLRETGWNISQTASRLGLSRNTVRHRIAKHGLRPDTHPASTGGTPGVTGVPVAAAAAPRHNLPRPLTSFVGRERELEEVARRLATAGLLTLTGAGGSGKTRLALEVAAGFLGEYPDGVWLVELGALAEPGLVLRAVATVLGVREEPVLDLLDTLTVALRDRRLLLLLDGCEHVVTACAQVTRTLLAACPALRILATSREPLDVPGEVTWRVPGLSLPSPDSLPALEELGRYEAVRLFVERARAADPQFTVSPRNALAVAQVCYRLDGIPLAIELAAARLSVLTVEQVNARLHDRFRLLTGGSRASLPRQQTLRAAMDWSYELLAEAERRLLERVSVFAGPFSLEAAEAVCDGGGEGPSVLDLISSLVRRSLVSADVSGGEARYRLLETVRAYGQERLRASGNEPAVAARHRAWYVALAEQAERMFEEASRGADQVAWLDRLESEHDNIRAALAPGDDGPAGEEARLRLAAALWRFWEVRGRQGEGREWLDGILATTLGARSAARANALNGAGSLARNQGDLARAAALHEQALALRRALGDTRGVAGSLNNLGVVAHDLGKFAEAVAYLEEAIPLWEVVRNPFGLALSLNNLGRAVRFQGDFARAETLAREALRRWQALAHTWGIARALNSLGDVAFNRSDPAPARVAYEESLRLRREVGDQQGIAVLLTKLGDLAGREGRLEEAQALCEEGLALRRSIGARRGIAISLASLGLLARARGDLARATALCADSLALRQEMRDGAGLAAGLEALGGLAAAGGQAERAARLLAAAEAQRERLGAPLPPVLGVEHGRDVALARTALGEGPFAAAWHAGRALPLEAAVAEALAGSALAGRRPAD